MLHGITEYPIRKMNNDNIPFRSIVILLFTVLLSSCLKETAVPIESAFSIESSEDKTSPVTIQLKNVYVVKQKCTTANVVIYSDISLFYYQKFFCLLNFALLFLLSF